MGTDAPDARRSTPARTSHSAAAGAPAIESALAGAGRRPVARRATPRGPLVAGAILALAAMLALAPGALGWGATGEIPAAAVPATAPAEVLTAAGSSLRAGPEDFVAAGFNDYRLSSLEGGYVCDEGRGALDGAAVAERLDRAQAAGATMIRTWYFQNYWDPGGSGDGDFASLERLLGAAAERGIRVVPVLSNHWGDCTGAGGGAADKRLEWYEGGFRAPTAGEALSFLEYAQRIAARFAGDPRVAFWQLVNEPEGASDGACDEARAAAALGTFASESAAAIRAADPHHLISLGTIGSGQCGAAGANYVRIHVDVDLCELHVYDTPETGTAPTDPLPGDGENGVAARIAQCEAAGKPVIAGEIGFAADLDADGGRTGVVTDETLANRAAFLQARVAAMRTAGLDGFLVWQLEDAAPGPDAPEAYGVGPCDPLLAVVAEHGAPGRLASARETGCGEAHPGTTLAAIGG